MTIQWFPGHMLETKKWLHQSAAKADVIMEMLDARIPVASENPWMDKISRNARRVKILNKMDLADPRVTEQWVTLFEKHRHIRAIAINATDRSQAARALEYALEGVSCNRARKQKVMVVGIPNTGKSTLLNTLAGKKIAKTGNTPAITRHQQRTSLPNNIDLYDTPGVLWPVIEPPQRAYALAVTGAISDAALDFQDIAWFAAGLLLNRYPEQLKARYPFLDTIPDDEAGLLEQIGAARGCLKAKGQIDFHKAATVLIQDFRSGKIGKISVETPLDTSDDEEKKSDPIFE
ncbi:MAG: ribosome biogenesis GTPase YlqF [Desulfotignum sp.]|nr:ribosome biogenesis GTPase YlqF [Desulfotignum sp.]MCF8087197.1 ribosome biogenesis GTPase YlqF [Desulfotignum sp.]MCF8138356.1 ribosome biogenesis GTPase YlqF [Desulfotignum sp.]